MYFNICIKISADLHLPMTNPRTIPTARAEKHHRGVWRGWITKKNTERKSRTGLRDRRDLPVHHHNNIEVEQGVMESRYVAQGS